MPTNKPTKKRGAKRTKETKRTKDTKRTKKPAKVEEPKQKRADPMFPVRHRNLRIGGDIRPKRDLSRFVRWPRYVRIQRQRKVLLQRLKVPPSINQFRHSVDKNEAGQLFRLLMKYRPETKTQKNARLRKLALEKKNSKKPVEVPQPPPVIKFGLKHVTSLIEEKKAQLVIIPHDVDPIELVVWIPALCRKMDVPYCIVKSKARLGALVHQKNAAVVCLTAVKQGDEHKLNTLAQKFKTQFNENIQNWSRWGGGIMGLKTQAKLEKRQKAIEAEEAKKRASQY